MRIKFSSAPSGSGKTHQIVNRACEWARRGNRVLILQPTKALINKTVATELLTRSKPPRYKVFHGDEVPDGKVAKQMMDYIKGFDEGGGQIVFATHQVLPLIPHFPNKGWWHVSVDEAPQVLAHASPQISLTIAQHLRLEQSDAIYSRLTPANKAAVRKMANNESGDEVFEHFADIARRLTNRHWASYVNTEQFERLKRGEATRLDVHSVLQPSLYRDFASVFMAAANFEDTAIYQYWSDLGVQFEEDVEFTRSLRFQEHQNGHLIKMLYATDGSWSRARQRQEHNGTTTLDLVAVAAAKVLGNAEFVWQANKTDAIDHPAFRADRRLPNMPHGLNDYSSVNNIVFLSALGATPAHLRFLKHTGMDSDGVRRAIYHQGAYQSVNRISVRDPTNTEPKIIIVPDCDLAEYLQDRFPGSMAERFDAKVPVRVQKPVGRPKKHENNSAKVKEHRQKKKQELLTGVFGLECQYDSRGELRYENTIRLYSDFVTQLPDFSIGAFQGTLYTSTNSFLPLAYITGNDPNQLIDGLKELFDQSVEEKHANFLISPAIFDPNKPNDEGKKRGRVNIVYLRHLWFDFEDGELRPDELPSLFPRIRMVVTNSYHHTTEKPRFHVLIPVKQPLTPEAYEALWAMFAYKLEDAGYQVWPRRRPSTRPASGLDLTKRTPTSLFYLPCQAEDPSQSFFIDHKEPPRDILDAVLWISNSIIPCQPDCEQTSLPENENGPIDQVIVNTATAEWRDSKNHPAEGNDRFFRYALELRRAGMGPTEIQAKLTEEAKHGRTASDRRRQISSIMQTLGKPPRSIG